jgi:CHAD domain-containing protein
MKARRVKSRLHQCKGLQKDLGNINDAAMAETLVARLSNLEPELAPAASALTSWAEERRTNALGHLHQSWRSLKEARRPAFIEH